MRPLLPALGALCALALLAAPARAETSTVIAVHPADPTADATATFAFQAPDPAATFECALDVPGFTPCAADQTFTNLPDGEHTLLVRAVDALGAADPEPASFTWTSDTVEPDVTLSSPGLASPTNAPTAAFTVAGNEPLANRRCRLDARAWEDCSVPVSYAALPDGTHTVTAEATDLAGNPGTDTMSWTVDRIAPTAAFVTRPAALTNDASPGFAWTAEDGADVTCSLDGAEPVPCAGSAAWFGLADGRHDLRVVARDLAGNESPIAYTWTQDTQRPQTTLTSGPATSAPVASPQATLAFSSPDGVRFECMLDGSAWAPCASPVTYGGLISGAHSFSVRAIDAAGNVDGTPAGRTWTVRMPGAPTAQIAVSRDDGGFVLDGGASSDPEGGRLTYRWLRNGDPAGAGATVHYDAPDHEARDAFTLTVTDADGRQGRAIVALRTRAATEPAPHEVVEAIRFGTGTRLAAGARARIAALRAVVGGATEVRIEGHARSSADATALSRRRARTVRRLLLKGLAAPAKVTVTGRGSAGAAASNATAAGRARNDRVVVTVRYNGPAVRLVTEQEDRPAVRLSTAPQPVAAASGAAPKLFAFYSAVPGALRRLQEVGARVDVLAPNWYSLSPASGAVRGGRPNAKVMALSRQLRFDVWPVVNATMKGSSLLDTAAGRAKVVDAITTLATRQRLAGVTLDMEEMLPRQQASFSALVAQLGAGLHRSHRKLGVYAVRRTDTEVTDSAAAYDWPALARAADLVLASGYNEHAATTAAGPVTTQAGFDRLARYAASVSRTKVAPTIGAFGYRWGGGGARMLSSADAERRWPVRAEVGSADGRSDGATYFESAEDLWAREQAARRAGARWIGLFSLGREPERFWERSAVR